MGSSRLGSFRDMVSTISPILQFIKENSKIIFFVAKENSSMLLIILLLSEIFLMDKQTVNVRSIILMEAFTKEK